MHRWKRLAGVLLGFVAVMSAVVVVNDRRERYRHAVAPTDPTPLPFQSAGWASGSATIRHGMARQMIASGELIGLQRNELENRLGDSSSKDGKGRLMWYLGERQDPTGVMWNYEEYLVVRLDNGGVCREAIIFGRD